MNFLTEEAILGLVSTAVIHEFTIEGVGTFYLKGMTAQDRDAWEMSILGKDGQPDYSKLDNMRAKLVARTLVNQDGKRIFDNAGAAKLGNLPAVIVNALYEKAQDINGMREPQAVEDVLKKA